MICFPNAKINLGLHIINQRDDGFHNIETVLYPLKFSEMLEMVKSKTSASSGKTVGFLSEGLKINADMHDNLVVKAFDLLDREFGLGPVKIYLYKHIPMGAGLGGGSSDAAFALRLLNDLFDLGLSLDQLAAFAAQLGSDCPFFIQNKPAYLFGRGHELSPLEIDLSSYFIAILYNEVPSSTALAYKNATRRGTMGSNTTLAELIRKPIHEWKHSVENDFEESVFGYIPQLGEIKNKLYEQGALYASMSGSGSAMFGIFDHLPQLTPDLMKLVYFRGKM